MSAWAHITKTFLPPFPTHMTTKGVGTAHVRDKGRVTIPAAVRRQLDLEQGDLVRIRVESIEGGGTDD